jgi:hypothetical protein
MVNNKAAVAESIGVPVHNLNYIFVFANTGREHEDTLRFLNDVDTHFLNGELVWLEAIAHHGQRKGSTHRVTCFEDAYGLSDYLEDSHPFHDSIKKYGIPTVNFKSCTRELKLAPMKSYFKSQGITDYYTAIGIRDDETRRVSKNAEATKIMYPLVDMHPTDKQDVLDYMSQFPWDLSVPEWQGNCVTCHKKSFKKLKKVYEETPKEFEFSEYMEGKYPKVGPEFAKHGVTRPRTFYRHNNSTSNLIEVFNMVGVTPDKYLVGKDAGCSESCELFEMDDAK